MNPIELAKTIKSLPAIDVVGNELVKQQFIHVYNATHKRGGEEAYDRESHNVFKLFQDNRTLLECTPMSVYYCFIDVAVKGLTLDNGTQRQCYLVPRNAKVGTDPTTGRATFAKVCNLIVSGWGDLYMRMAVGQIRHADSPVMVYEGDQFSFGEIDGRKVVNYMGAFPRKSNKIIAAYIKIVRVDGTLDYCVMTENDWLRLANYSAKQNKGEANELFTSMNGSIDSGFLASKLLKQAFKTYPKIVIGGSQYTVSEDDVAPEEFETPSIQAPANPFGIEEEDVQMEYTNAPTPVQATIAPVTNNTIDDDMFN